MTATLSKLFAFFFTFGFAMLYPQQLVPIAVPQNQNTDKVKNLIYFNPEVDPNVEEIKSVTYDSFFSAVTDRLSTMRNVKFLRAETPLSYSNTDIQTITEICRNNNADYAVVPKVKFFKVGIGKYVLSSQVIISLKVYDAAGNYITEANYDTFRKNARILGSAENSIKIGTNGALKIIIKNFRKLNPHQQKGS